MTTYTVLIAQRALHWFERVEGQGMKDQHAASDPFHKTQPVLCLALARGDSHVLGL